jgi:putative peptide zinc metalloprotease protein
MLCHACHVHVRRDFPYCLKCGTLRKGAKLTQFAAPELRVGERTYPLVRPITTIGRSAENDIVLDDESVSRRHARITRGPEGFAVEDLDSFNGTTVGDRVLHGDRHMLPDDAEIFVGDVSVRFAQPRSAAVGGKTMVKGTEHTLLASAAAMPEEAATAGGPLSARPRRRSGWALKQVPGERGQQGWVLRNTRSGQYLELDERDVFIWNALDGENTVRDLLFLYADRYGELALPRIEQALRTFAAADLVRGLYGQPDAERPPFLTRLGRGIVKALLRLEISVKGLDGLIGALYRRGGWRLFTRTSVFLLWVLILGGMYGFYRASGHRRLFDVGGAGATGAVIVAVGYLLALVLHELLHALAVKSYGRRVTRGGFMMVMGMPFAFVDTSDMWFGTRWSRIVVTISGPLSTLGLAGACGLAAAYAPSPVVGGIAYQLAFGLYLNSLYNLNPLMPLDGYQALADALRQPRLRAQATAYFTRGIWADLVHGRRPKLRQVGLAAYGMIALVGTVAMVAVGLFSWRTRLGGLADRYLPPALTVPVIVVGIGVAMFPIWYRMYKKLISLMRRPSAEPAAATAAAAASAPAEAGV